MEVLEKLHSSDQTTFLSHVHYASSGEIWWVSPVVRLDADILWDVIYLLVQSVDKSNCIVRKGRPTESMESRLQFPVDH